MSTRADLPLGLFSRCLPGRCKQLGMTPPPAPVPGPCRSLSPAGRRSLVGPLPLHTSLRSPPLPTRPCRVSGPPPRLLSLLMMIILYMRAVNKMAEWGHVASVIRVRVPLRSVSGRHASSPHSGRLATATDRPSAHTVPVTRPACCVLGKLYIIHVCRLLHAGTVCFRIGLRDCCRVR